MFQLDYDSERERVDDIDELDAVWSGNGIELKLEIAQLSPASEREEKRGFRVSLLRKLGLRVDGSIAVGAMKTMSEALGDCPNVIAACIDSVPESVEPPALSIAHILTERQAISELVDCVLLSSESGGKDKLAERIGIAIRLLSEAADQNSTAVSLALTVTALESLLSNKGEAIAKSLAERVAVLMESRMEHRLRAEKFVEDLYDQRSRVLHGDDIGPRADWYRKARFLVLRVIYRIVQWRLTLRKFGEEDMLSPEQLIHAIKEVKYGRSPFTGAVEVDDVAVFLWSPSGADDTASAGK